MVAPPAPQKPRRAKRAPGSLGRTIARVFCLIFALIGAIPLSGGLLLRSEPLQKWAASETSRLLREQLGLEATFSVQLSLIPLRLAVSDLTVPASDQEADAISADLIAVSPRFFSLLAGRIDVGDIELENTSVRLIIEEGKVQNVAYRFPESEGDSEINQAPFRSLAITNARLNLEVDGTQIHTGSIDVDAVSEGDLSFDIALRADGADFLTRRVVQANEETGSPGGVAFDEDRLCELDLRVFLSEEEIIIRRLSLLGFLDSQMEAGTRPDCTKDSEDKLALRLSQVKVHPQKVGLPHVRGHVMFRAPLSGLGRVADGMVGQGWVGYSGNVAMDGTSKLPELSGKLSGKNMHLNEFSLSEHLSAEIHVSGDVIQSPHFEAGWGNGTAILKGVKVEPFAESMPLSVAKIYTREVDLPGVMRDIGVSNHSWVDWNFGSTDITRVRGTLSPFYLDGGVSANTHDYVVWDRGFDDPARVRMIGIPHATVEGRFRAHGSALEFYNSDLKFGESHLPIDLVSVGFYDAPLIVRLKEGGGTLNLANVSPIAKVELGGTAQIYVDMAGPMTEPNLNGTLSVQDLMVGGFEAGNVEKSKVHFEPLFVEFSELVGQKGELTYELPSARLAFDTQASVEFSSGVKSSVFDIEEFLKVFHFNEDPRFADLKGKGSVNAQVRYLLGGPEDTCGDGRLSVSGEASLRETILLDEKYSGGDAEFFFEWFDIEAGSRGIRLDVPNLTLRKGSGSVFGSVEIKPGGLLSGDIIGTRVPVSRIDALGKLLHQTDGFVTGAGQLSGSLESLAFTADVDVTNLKAGKIELPASRLSVHLVPAPNDDASTGEVTGCERSIPREYTNADYIADKSAGTFVINGQLFGEQIALKDFSVTRQRNQIISGQVSLNHLDVGSLVAFASDGILTSDFQEGVISGVLDIEHLDTQKPFDAEARLALSEVDFQVQDLKLALEDQRMALSVHEGEIRSEHLSLRATTEGGQSEVLDGELLIDRNRQIKASLDLRPTSLALLAATIPGISRAEGKLAASFGLEGPLLSPEFRGFIQVEEGDLSLDEISTPLTDLNLTVAMDRTGLHVMEGRAKWGGGEVTLRGEAPLTQGKLGRTELSFFARAVTLPVEDDIKVQLDADLKMRVPAPSAPPGELPRLSGNVNVLSASYTKPMSITADISTLTGRGEKTEVEGYDAAKDTLELDVLITSSEPIVVENELVEATLAIDPAGLRISGTNQKFGAVGTVEIISGGRVFLRRNEFDLQGGLVRFNDPTRLRPEVDVTALTEYRRFEDRGATSGDSVTTDTSNTASQAGNWRILMHAYGPPENLKVDLTSDPPLAQDDIFLLLTVGLTRTELDQTRNSGIGSSVALEALGSLSGAETAVTDTVPVDEFRLGSSYSSRSGRTEPTVTIGKRLSERMRASVTTSISDTSEVRSNVEYRATENLSIEGSYDNSGNSASASGANIGGDIRWRLEFK